MKHLAAGETLTVLGLFTGLDTNLSPQKTSSQTASFFIYLETAADSTVDSFMSLSALPTLILEQRKYNSHHRQI